MLGRCDEVPDVKKREIATRGSFLECEFHLQKRRRRGCLGSGMPALSQVFASTLLLSTNLFHPISHENAQPLYIAFLQYTAMHNNVTRAFDGVENVCHPIDRLDMRLKHLPIISDYVYEIGQSGVTDRISASLCGPSGSR